MTLNDGIAQPKPADDADLKAGLPVFNYVQRGPSWVPQTADANLTTLSMVTLAMTGASLSLPAAPAGASALQIQPQGGDVRVTLDSSAASATNGLIYYEGGIYDHPFADRAATRLFGLAGISVVLIWKGA